MRTLRSLLLAVSSLGIVLAACHDGAFPTPDGGHGGGTGGHASSSSSSGASSSGQSSTSSSSSSGAGGAGNFCQMPGSVQFANGVATTVPGGPASPDFGFLKLPDGFCFHYFGNVGNVRQLRFAPNGDLFVASPTTGTTGGGANGQSAIIVLPDADHDGNADAPSTYLAGLPSTQGMMFASGHFYYQDHTKILRVPYASGDHAPSGPAEQIVDITLYVSTLHWPKALDIADDGVIYLGNGGDEGEVCDPLHPFRGGIFAVDGSPGGKPVAKGCRNPIGVRCARGHDKCFAVELAKDYSMNEGGREKLLPIRQGDDWGFPCCAAKDLPYPGVSPIPDCSGVVAENASFIIGNTPFDLDFERGKWPAPYAGSVFVPLHGAAGSWLGARVVAIKMDPATGMPLPSSDLDGGSSGAMTDFATGWDDLTQSHGRPGPVAFAEDGRLFLGDDANGDILWIAPMSL